MAHGKEIEKKWFGSSVKRSDFSAFMFDQLKRLEEETWSFLSVKGPDHYWKIDDSFIKKAADEIIELNEGSGLPKDQLVDIISKHYPKNVIRHRVSEGTNELTTKARLLGEEGITVRYEYNIGLNASKNKQRELDDWLKLNNYRKDVTLIKDCDIFFVDYPDGAKVHTVWYEVFCKNKDNQIFIEVEVEGVSKERSLELLEKWSNLMRRNLGLTNDLISEDSLYELYTGNKYKEV